MDAQARYEAPGRHVDVDGRRLHVLERGSGAPTVVFVTGVGGTSLDWLPVMAALPGETHLLAYDRPGLGWSDQQADARHPDRVADELDAFLRATGAPEPYVFVAHSLGCRYVRLFTARRRASVAGLVLIDGFHETWEAAIGDAAFEDFIARRIRLCRLAALMNRAGLVRLLGSRGIVLLGPDFGGLPREERARYVALATQPRAMEVAIDELRRAGDANPRLADAPLGDLPLTVIAHGLPHPDDRLERAWQDSQVQMAARSSRGRLVRAQGVAHAVMIARPSLVAAAVIEILAMAGADPGSAGAGALARDLAVENDPRPTRRPARRLWGVVRRSAATPRARVRFSSGTGRLRQA
jgi:pimeloyl-ACP methyl ester carboxylesterase